ncbi:MAG: transcriptional repressor [Deltaproteobacteria bacterium]|nr:transcriptional repressor [Deltaproteobacteria bacterium]
MKANTKRQTRQLQVIWEAIKDEKSHPSADQVYEKVRRVMPSVSLGTVYRNLQKLVADEKLQVVTVGRTQRFDPTVEKHEHFICEACGRVYDFFVDSKRKIFSSSLPSEAFTVTSHQLALYGKCKSCQG